MATIPADSLAVNHKTVIWAYIPKRQRHTQKFNRLTQCEPYHSNCRIPRRALAMAREKGSKSILNNRFHVEGRYRSERPNAFASKTGTCFEDFGRLLFEVILHPLVDYASTENKGQAAKYYNQAEFPANSESQRHGTDEGDKNCDKHGDVASGERVDVFGVVCKTREKDARRVGLEVEIREWLRSDRNEILESIVLSNCLKRNEYSYSSNGQ
jgi:hypothetical protein